MTSARIAEFDIWRPGYGGAVVTVYVAGTTTLASLYADEDLTDAVSNPVTLQSTEIGGILYGKFAAPVYVGTGYSLSIDGTDETGIIRPPLTTLDGEDAHLALVRRAGQTADTQLEDVLARWVHASDFGALGASAATNTATLSSAIGVASAAGGGRVLLPGGTFPFTQITLPAGVVLDGVARGVTVLQSQTADKCVTISGDRAGLTRLTLDGVNLVASSTGLYAKACDETVFDDVEIKRFDTGLHLRGGRRARWRDLTVSNCASGAKLHGDMDASGGDDGDAFTDNRWTGGRVRQCTTVGVELAYEDATCWHNTLAGIGFEDNTGTALRVKGARWTEMPGCWWSGNTTSLAVLDDDDETVDDNTVVGLTLTGGEIDGGALTFADTCQDVLFDRMYLTGATVTLSSAQNAVLWRNVIEGPDLTLPATTKLLRTAPQFDGWTAAFTSDATPLKAWGFSLDPGQVIYAEAVVIATQRNGTGTCEYHFAVSARRSGSLLQFDAQTANFTVGDILEGAVSGATARIIDQTDNGGSGQLTLKDIDGEFQDNEAITGQSSGGAALADGAPLAQAVSLLGSVTDLRAPREDVSGFAATFAASTEELEVRVTGGASNQVDWLVHVKVTT
jgi:hypothetical protein